ncbi:DUF2490 domain-containing protein [Flavobacterium sp. CS20]|uniref:DUF2490 domain-containing protein n=1 Tax=Flavobacterium sp. CS20 TaxID=2775246 RepID=UPI001B3A0F29|nr:DUF2490 domain-containing protein [Flavobacterium sp. CS20]QTY27162.1 DUF2490 domain-containing protein [Flavobacterium sp. CS20]
MLKPIGVCLFFVLFSFKLSAQQKNVETQNLLWTRYLLNFHVSEKWTPFFDVEERMYMFPFRQHHFLPSIGANYKLSDNVSFTVAMMYFELTLPQNPNADFTESQQELRPQVAVNYRHKLDSKFSFLSRLKLEWRYKKPPDDSSYNFTNYRLRMRLGLAYNINEKFTANLLEEIHINIGDKIVRNVFDQNRLSAGLNYKINDKFQIETGYMNWFQQKSTGDDFYSRNIVYFTLRHNLKFY